jgi:hypothetical protein
MPDESSPVTIGLCAACRHARQVTSARGATFWRCALSARDPRFPRYPRLPVLHCAGYSSPGASTAPSEPPHE